MDDSVIAQRHELVEGLRAQRKELLEMCASKGWEQWLAWSNETVLALREVAFRDADPAVREQARQEALALEKFSRLPTFLLSLTQDPS
jgi:hypothetical protein